MSNDANIVIIGGGPAGLTTAGALAQLGIASVVLDNNARVGDVWARRYDRLHLHTLRAFSGLAHLPIPRRNPRYLSRDQFVRYLQDYARHFTLNIQHDCTVSTVHGDGASWTIETNIGRWRAPCVVVAVGQYGTPTLPNWEGRTEYRGELLHSVSYRSGASFDGKRVLVIGAGNSGTEIAVDLLERGATYVANSIRTPPPVVPREFLGAPVQLFGMVMSALPPRLADRMGSAIARLATGDLRGYGVRAAAWQPFTAHKVPIIDVGWIAAVKSRRLHVRGDIARFTPTGVEFGDGTAEDFDVVIAATGFATGLATLIDAPGSLDDRGFPRHRSGGATNHPGLHFMGYTESTRGHLFEANHDSRRLAQLIKRDMATPSSQYHSLRLLPQQSTYRTDHDL